MTGWDSDADWGKSTAPAELLGAEAHKATCKAGTSAPVHRQHQESSCHARKPSRQLHAWAWLLLVNGQQFGVGKSTEITQDCEALHCTGNNKGSWSRLSGRLVWPRATESIIKKGIFPDYTCAGKVNGSLPHEVTEVALGTCKPHALQRTQNRWGSSICPDPLLFGSSAFWVMAMVHQGLCWTPNSIKEGFRYHLFTDVPQTWKDTSVDLYVTSYLRGKCYQQSGEWSQIAGMILLTWNNQTQEQIPKYRKMLLSWGQLPLSEEGRSCFPGVWERWGWTTAWYCCLEGLFRVL